MTRSVLVAAVSAAALVLAAGYAVADPDVGCGLGTQVWEGSSGSIVKAFAATTNGTSGNQTFGVSSGTSGCNQGGTVTAEVRVREFVGANLDQIARDAAHGGGESLHAFSQLLGVRDGDRSAFFALTQTHFDALFSEEGATAGSMLASLRQLLAKDPQLSGYAEI